MSSRRSGRRGFTLIEMVTSVFILGLIVLLIGYEFDHTIWHLLHTQSNVDAESNARTALVQVVNGLRAATPDTGGGSDNNVHEVVLQPTSGVASSILEYRRAQAGSLAIPLAIATNSATGAPQPPFYDVTIQCMSPYPAGFTATPCSAAAPQDLVETVADDTNPTVILGQKAIAHDVSGFSVLNTGASGADQALLQISITVAHPFDAKSAQFATSRCNPTCQYTVTAEVWVGGEFNND